MKVRKLARNRFDLLYELVKTNFKMRYYNSFLGVLWVLIKPYSTFAVLYVLWSNTSLGRADAVSNYALYLLLGIVIYTFVNEMIIFGQAALIERANIILKVNFPRQLAVVAALSNAVVNLLINLIFVFVVIFISGFSFNLEAILVLALVSITIYIWGLGLAFLSSVITIRFRDLKNILELGMFLMMYATPIFYEPSSFIGDGLLGKVISANPLGIIINQIRAGFGVYGEVNYGLMATYFVAGIIFLLLTSNFFDSAVKKVAEYI